MSGWRFDQDLRRLGEEIEPDEAALVRLRPRRPAPAPRWRPLVVGVALAVGLALLWLRPPTNLNLALDAPTWQDRALVRDVGLRFQGHGLAQGTPVAPVIQWEEGTISLEVTPNRGLDVRVRTPEAEVVVVGTRFAVTRDGLGTAVSVERGRVSVNCSDGTARFLTPGQRLHCPRSAAAALAHARALAEQGADPAERLDTLQRALAGPDADEAVRDELRMLQVSTLEDLGRDREALAVAEDALAAGSPPRWRALASVAARLRVAQGDCTGALPHLERLTADQDDPVALVLLADCVQDREPARARAALRRAASQDLAPEQARAVADRLRALGE